MREIWKDIASILLPLWSSAGAQGSVEKKSLPPSFKLFFFGFKVTTCKEKSSSRLLHFAEASISCPNQLLLRQIT